MNIETLLCRAFCDGLSVKQIGSGLSVATPFEDASGDRIGFYLVHDEDADLWRIEDDGALVPTLIAGGVAVEEGARGRLFQSLLKQAHAQYDSESGELKTAPLTEAQIPGAAMRFVALLLRVAGLSSLRPEIVYTTFREDAVARIRSDLGSTFSIREREPLTPALDEFMPDVVLVGNGTPPCAVFVAVSDARLYEAMFLRFAADHEVHLQCTVVALYDRENSRLTTGKLRQRAANRLDAVPVFYGEEGPAILRIAREAHRGYSLGPLGSPLQ